MNSPPTTLGKYQIIREIARSNDIVYEAYDPLMNRRVALKELSMPGGSTPQQRDERISRFKREARAAGTLANPNIMTVYELGEDGDRYFIAMEFLDGQTLRSEIDTKGSLSIDRAIEVTNQVLNGLEFAHSKGVIHRDIKPDNIQILSDGRIKLTDFGIARLTFEPNLTMDGQVFGTPSYMSPEQVVGKDIDARSDLFSVAIVLYEMIGGRKPFTGDSVVSITYSIMNKEPDQLSETNYALWQVLARALDKSPALRYSSAAEFKSALAAAQAASAGPVLDNVPPQVYNSYAATGNPYLPPPGMSGNSYGAGPAPVAPPILYSFNPYAAQPQQQPAYYPDPMAQMGQNTLMGSNYVPNPSGLPIYYPPPPRQPMFKPETKQFLGKLAVSLLIAGTIVVVVLMIINSLTESVQKTELEQKDEQTAAATVADLKRYPLNQQIQVMEQAQQDLKSPVVKDEVQKQTASLYQQQGEHSYEIRDYASAEKSFLRANELDPDNGLYFGDLGRVYDTVAQEENNVQANLELWSRSSESWINAAKVEQDPAKKTVFAAGAARSSFNYANQLMTVGDFTLAKQHLLDAKKFTIPNSALSEAVDAKLQQLDTAPANP